MNRKNVIAILLVAVDISVDTTFQVSLARLGLGGDGNHIEHARLFRVAHIKHFKNFFISVIPMGIDDFSDSRVVFISILNLFAKFL